MLRDVTIRVSDLATSAEFYVTVLDTLGLQPTARDEEATHWRGFRVAAANEGKAVTRGLHIGFAAPSRAAVDAFWRAGTEAGHRDDGAPGPRPLYDADYYGGFLLDPDANSAEAAHHDAMPGRAAIDHLWIRVADLAASKRFYAQIAVRAGLRLGTGTPEHVQLRATNATFSLVEGAPTEHLEMAFAVPGEGASLRDPDGNVVELVESAE